MKSSLRSKSVSSEESKSSGRADNVFSDWIDQPLECGFLRLFAEYEFSSENINFLIAIDDFRDKLGM